MKYHLLNDLVKDNSFAIQGLLNRIDNQNYTGIKFFNTDFLGLLVGLTKQKRCLILTDDQIKARQFATNIEKWGLNQMLVPCSWTQIEIDELRSLSQKMNNFLQGKDQIVVASTEEWHNDWMYSFVELGELVVGCEYSFNELSKKLSQAGFNRVNKINMPGEFSILGDSWMIKSITNNQTIKLGFEGKKLIYLESIGDEKSEILQSIDMGGVLLRSDDKLSAKKELFKIMYFDLVIKIGEQEEYILNTKKTIGIGIIEKDQKSIVDWPMEKMLFDVGGQTNFLECINKYKIKKSVVVTGRPEEFRRWVNELNLKYSDFLIVEGDIPCGGFVRSDKIALWSDLELYGRSFAETKKVKSKVNFKKLAEYKVGDLVVHLDHGVGILKDFATREFGGIKKDYLVIAYDRGDLLYVPVEQLNKISKYIGAKLSKLNRLGGRIWERRKRKAKKDVEFIARELLKLYAKRKLVNRKPYGLQKNVLERLDHSFDYELTVDQDIALEEINRDLDHGYPMDRLLCGDVGFGKTELAIRIAARVAANKKQVAILAPTTILCEQHFVTFVSRLSGLGMRVEVLSRLRDKKYQDQVTVDIEKGKVDIVIGTHRLLQKDIVFKNIGLLIIDEEQKFGVRAKERLKEIRSDVDVLSMSATPIPRTLNISMGGVRDMSILEIPPVGRQVIDTEVMHYSQAVVKEAIERELSRGGQVYIVHNRVRTIEKFKLELINILGEKVGIAVAHGQMTETQLADTMSKFATNKFQVLLATTIVENGLDLPNVNTLIVENASGLGLSQLYQLRGRVGRSDKKAYAYFLYRSDKLKNKAKQRLSAISEATELGSGLKLAISDMEIRGVGNVLGVEQHGNAYAVGLGMFLDMIEESVDKLKNGETDDLDEGEILIDLPLDMYIPNHYIENRDDRLYWEQRLAVQTNDDDVEKVLYEMQSKYGHATNEVINLAKVTKLKNRCLKCGISSIVFDREKQQIRLDEGGMIVIGLQKNRMMAMIEKLYQKNSMWVIDGEKIKISTNSLGEKWLDKLVDSF